MGMTFTFFQVGSKLHMSLSEVDYPQYCGDPAEECWHRMHDEPVVVV